MTAQAAVTNNHILVFPGSLLRDKRNMSAIAAALPEGEALFVMPEGDGALRRSMESVAAEILRRGRRVTRISAQFFAPK